MQQSKSRLYPWKKIPFGKKSRTVEQAAQGSGGTPFTGGFQAKARQASVRHGFGAVHPAAVLGSET